MEGLKKRQIHTKKVLTTYFRAAWRYPWHVTGGFLGAIGLEIANVTAPIYLKKIVNVVSTGPATGTAMHIVLIALGSYGVISFIGWLFQRLRMSSITYMESWVMRDLSNSAYEVLMRHSHDFFQSNFTGTLTRRVARYSKSFEPVFDSFVLTYVPIVFYIAGSIIILSERNLLLGLGVAIWTILFVIIQHFMTKWRHEYKLQRAAEDSAVTGLLSDSVSNHSTITLFASLKREQVVYGTAVEKWMRANLATWNADNTVYSVQGIIAVISEVAILWGAIYFWSKGLLTPGDFVLIQVYVLGIVTRLWDLGRVTRRLNDSYADASEMIDILELEQEISDIPNAMALQVSTGHITFKEVDFGFASETTVLKSFSLEIPGGQKVALVGTSGAGKSTIVKLLLRLHDVSAGSVQIDGQTISEVTQLSLREQIGYVPQESILFHRTLRENIAYGKADATEEEIIEASKKAHAHEFITRFPLGYETLVGERGVKLSGGERQRIAIARAILKNAPILVLDEATSSLDSESEHYIQEALHILMEGKTVIVIAHRLSTIMDMDRIIVMERGTIVADGSHEELLKQNGLYAKLWNIQAGGFIGDLDTQE